jgi:hypothetical protein
MGAVAAQWASGLSRIPPLSDEAICRKEKSGRSHERSRALAERGVR